MCVRWAWVGDPVLSRGYPVAVLFSGVLWLLPPGSGTAQSPTAAGSHQCSGYSSPGTATVHCTFSYDAGWQLESLLWETALPAEWNLEAVFGDGDPEIGTNSEQVVFTGTLTNNPVMVELLVSVPPGEEGPRSLTGRAEYQLDSMVNPTSIWANPDPLFVDSHHRIHASAGPHGWISPSGVVSVIHAGATNFDMGGDTYYHISDLIVDAVTLPATNRYAFTNVTGGHTIRVDFAENLACLGTPEWWLAWYRLTNETVGFCAAETNDTDGDGMPAWKEWGSDTVPTNPGSVLTLLDVSVTNGDVRLTWRGGTNAWQVLEIRPDLTGTTGLWSAILTNVPPTPVETNYLHRSVTNRSLFYRVRAWRP